MAAVLQRGRGPTQVAGDFPRYDSGPSDTDSDSEESEADVPPSGDGPSIVSLKHPALAATASPKGARIKAAPQASPSQGGLLWRLGALRRSVSPAKKGAAGAASVSPQKPLPAPSTSRSSSDVTAVSTSAAVPAERQQATFRPHGSRPQMNGNTAAAGQDPQTVTHSSAAARTPPLPQHTQPHGANPALQKEPSDGARSGRPAVARQDSAAARIPEKGSHRAAAMAAAGGMARSGSDASSLATESTIASGVSSGLGNARTAADSYGGSVFASALNQEAGLQLLSQVQQHFNVAASTAVMLYGVCRVAMPHGIFRNIMNDAHNGHAIPSHSEILSSCTGGRDPGAPG